MYKRRSDRLVAIGWDQHEPIIARHNAKHNNHHTNHIHHDTKPKNDPWRRYGRARRQWLVDNDSFTFRIHSAVAIEHYYELGNRIWVQLLELKQDTANDEDAYTLACRFKRYLESDLPRHPHYDVSHAPVYPILNQVLEQLAIRIDEEQLNKFVDMSLDPAISSLDRWDDDEDDTDASRHDDDDNQWESFSGWSFDVPGCSDTTDESSFSQHSQPTYEEPRYESFLEHIAMQAVEFESDSEAADSWAPSVCSSAFAQQLHRHQSHLAILQKQLEKLQTDDSM